MATGPEVKTRITIDDAATKTLRDIATGFRNTGEAAEKSTDQTNAFVKKIAALGIGIGILHQMRSGLLNSFDAAVEADRSMRQLTQSVIGVQKYGGQSFQQLQVRAEAVRKTIDDIAASSMVSRTALVETFNDAAKNTSLTDTQLVKLIDRVSSAARALPAPVKDVVAGFEELNKNMISAGNPIVLMVKQAFMLRGHSERIAKEMEWMGKTRRIEYAQKALAILGERAKQIPPALEDMVARFDDIKTDSMRAFGAPLLRAFMPALEGVYRKITEGKGDIEAYARELGMQVGEWVIEAAEKIKEGFQYLRENGSDIKKNIVEAFHTARDVFAGIYTHSKEIAAIFAAVKGSQLAAAGGVALSGMASRAVGIAAAPLAIGGINAALMPGSAIGAGAIGAGAAAGSTLAGAAAFLGPQGALTALVLSTMALKTSFDGLMEDLDEQTSDSRKGLQAQLKYIENIGTSYKKLSDEETTAFERVKQAALESAEALGMNRTAVAQQIESQVVHHRNLESATMGAQTALENMRAAQEKVQFADTSANYRIEADRMKIEAARQFAESFNAAAETNYEAALRADATMAMSSNEMKETLVKNGAAAGLALEKLADAVASTDAAFAKDLRQAALRASEKGDKATRNMIFNGAQFTIKQDFRDQDPDRVAVVFQRDIQRAAENRLMARTSLAFGG